MPRYAFDCQACGPFEVWRPVEEAGAALHCPTCQGPARRSFSAPGLARMAAPLRAARDREERSAHAPDVVSVKSGRPMPGHGHGHGHGAHGGHGH